MVLGEFEASQDYKIRHCLKAKYKTKPNPTKYDANLGLLNFKQLVRVINKAPSKSTEPFIHNLHNTHKQASQGVFLNQPLHILLSFREL